jgi:hypothetical protein
MKMIMKIQNRSWSDFVWFRSRHSRTSDSSSSRGYYRCKSWRYDMQWSTSTLSRQWSSRRD